MIDEDITNNCFRFVSKNRIVEGVFKPEAEDSFIPREEVRFKSLINPNSPQKNTPSDFTAKTSVATKSRGYREKSPTEKPLKYKPAESQQYFLDQSPVESDNESEDSEVINQVDKLMLGE